jgi:hypothetical protein
MLETLNPSGHWRGIVPPQYIFAQRRFKCVVLEPPDLNPGSWIGAGKVVFDSDTQQFLLTARPRKAEGGVRGFAANVYRSSDGETFELVASLSQDQLSGESGLSIRSIEGTQILKDPLTGNWHLYASVDLGSEFIWGGMYWQTLLLTAPVPEGPWQVHGLVLKSDQAYDANQARDSTVDIVDGRWFCLYKAMDGLRARRPALATSTDGITWRKHGVLTIEGKLQRAFLSGTLFASGSGPLFIGIEKMYSEEGMAARDEDFADKFRITHGSGPKPSFVAYQVDHRNMNLELVFRTPWEPLSPYEHQEHPLLGYSSVVFDPLQNRMLTYAQAIDRETTRFGINSTVERLILYESPL